MSIWTPLKQSIVDRAEALGQKARLIKLPFFDGEPLYDVAVFFWKSMVDGAISTRASAIAFNFILAIFPAIIFLFTLIPYIPIDNFQQQLFDLLQSILPQDTIKEIIMIQRGNWLSFGFLAAFIFATNGIVSVIAAFNGTIHAIETRSWINQRVVALILAVILTLLMTISIA